MMLETLCDQGDGERWNSPRRQ